MSQYKLNDLKPGQLLTITPLVDGEPSPRGRIKAALPPNFGASVGSAFTDPFNNNVSAGSYDSIAEKASSYLGFSRKLGSRVTSVFYSGPEPTEISFEMTFESFYSAKEEVIIPVMKLMSLSVGKEVGAEELQEILGGFNNVFAEKANELIQSARDFSAGADAIKLIQGPPICELKFGKVMRFNRCYVSSVGVSFSNVLDNEQLPVSATCSVTVKIERNVTLQDIGAIFRGI